MSPDIERCSGGAPGGASASSQGGADIDGLRQRPLARHPLASGGDEETGLPGAAIKNTGDRARLRKTWLETWLFEK